MDKGEEMPLRTKVAEIDKEISRIEYRVMHYNDGTPNEIEEDPQTKRSIFTLN